LNLEVCNIISMSWCLSAPRPRVAVAQHEAQRDERWFCCSPVCHFAALFTLLASEGAVACLHKLEPHCTGRPATSNENVRGRNNTTSHIGAEIHKCFSPANPILPMRGYESRAPSKRHSGMEEQGSILGSVCGFSLRQYIQTDWESLKIPSVKCWSIFTLDMSMALQCVWFHFRSTMHKIFSF
jgi:hypothetical protein